MFNPLKLLGSPLLLVISFPLASFAAFTTTLAFTTLLIRVSLVYFELGLALLGSWLFATSTVKENRPYITSPAASSFSSTRRHHRRRSSVCSSETPPEQQITTVTDYANNLRHPPKSQSFASLVSTAGPDRDFEGVGGWRLSGDWEEEALWFGMNSRLERPAPTGERRRPRHRHHQRSLTSGSQWFGGSSEGMRMSPMQSRARTPSALDSANNVIGADGYFALQPHGRHADKSEPSVGKPKHDRQKNNSGSSLSSSSTSMGRSLRSNAASA